MYLVLAFVFHKYVPFGIQSLNSQQPVTNENKKEEGKYLVLLCQYKIHPARRPRSRLVHPKAGARARPAAAAPRPGDTTPGSTAPGHSKGKSPPRAHIASGKHPTCPQELQLALLLYGSQLTGSNLHKCWIQGIWIQVWCQPTSVKVSKLCAHLNFQWKFRNKTILLQCT